MRPFVLVYFLAPKIMNVLLPSIFASSWGNKELKYGEDGCENERNLHI